MLDYLLDGMHRCAGCGQYGNAAEVYRVHVGRIIPEWVPPEHTDGVEIEGKGRWGRRHAIVYCAHCTVAHLLRLLSGLKVGTAVFRRHVAAREEQVRNDARHEIGNDQAR